VAQHDEQLAHLQRLAGELARQAFRAELNTTGTGPYLQVTNPGLTDLSERVVCRRGEDGAWCFAWAWQQPIGGVDDVSMVARRIMTVLRSVEGNSL
jgi:hypothetical protein